MELRELRTSLFGFKKKDVCEYMARLRSELVENLEEDRENDKRTILDLEQRNAELNECISKLSAEKERLLAENAEKERIISALEEDSESANGESTQSANTQAESGCAEAADIIFEAKQFADSLRGKAEKENEELRRENAEYHNRVKNELSQCKSAVGDLRGKIAKTLKDIDADLSKKEDSIAELERKLEIQDI